MRRRAAPRVAREAREARLAESASKAQVAFLAGLPAQWRGKAYRRREKPKNPEEREQAEEKATTRRSRELLGLLVEEEGLAASFRLLVENKVSLLGGGHWLIGAQDPLFGAPFGPPFNWAPI